MSVFTAAEIAYLQSQRIGRIATVGPDGQPHVVPVGNHLAVLIHIHVFPIITHGPIRRLHKEVARHLDHFAISPFFFLDHPSFDPGDHFRLIEHGDP